MKKFKFVYTAATSFRLSGYEFNEDVCDSITVVAKSNREAYKIVIDKIHRKHGKELVYIKELKFLKEYVSNSKK